MPFLDITVIPVPTANKAAFDAMMQMKKVDIAAIEAAADAAG